MIIELYYLHRIWNSFQFQEYYNRTMHDLSLLQLETTVSKLQFQKKCGHFEQILSHIADDFIARYSAKEQVHPDFFKEDAVMIIKQFTLYSDQCIQAIKKFAFMDSPAEILYTLITSILKVNDYLAKQLYYHIKMEQTQHRSHITETLCSSCSRLRQNEKVRVLRQELDLNKIDLSSPKMILQVVTRKGLKYDVEQLLHEELQNLETLNENEVRKRLGKLQIYHDRRNQEINVCVQELARANQRVTGYSKAIEKKGRDECNFDMKQYVFQIGRHFYHNISSLDHKIKQLKQGLNPIIESQTQTETQIIVKSLHEEILNQYNSDIQKLNSNLCDLQSKIMIEQRKYKQQSDTCQMLQQKLRQVDVQREQLKIKSKIVQTQMKGALQKYQIKAQELQKMVEKLKFPTVDTCQPLNKLLSNNIQNKSEINNISSLNELQGPAVVQKQSKKILKSCLTLKKPQSKQNLLTIRLQQKINQLKDSKRGNPGYINDVTQSIEKIYSEIRQQNRERLKIQHVLDECVYLLLTKKERGNSNQKRISFYGMQTQNIRASYDYKAPLYKKSENVRYSQIENSSKIYKKAIIKIQDKKTKFSKLSSLKLKENFTFHQNHYTDCLKNDEIESQQFLGYVQQKTRLQMRKSVGMIKGKMNSRLNLDMNQRQKQFKKDSEQFDVSSNKVMKRRNLSQETIFDQKNQVESFRKSIDKLATKDFNLFSQEDNKILFQLKNSQHEQRSYKKSNGFKAQSHKTVLSLQQINFSTYFYSLIASLHVKNPLVYANLKKKLSIVPSQRNEQDGIKNSLNSLISNHRRCKGNGSVCAHLQNFLQRVKNL